MTKSVLVAALALSTTALAGTPPEGVEYKPRRGFFTETDIGMFFTLGGENTVLERPVVPAAGRGV